MKIFSWRSVSWTRNIWTSGIVALLSVQIAWLVVGAFKGFDMADSLLKDYLWYVLGGLYLALLIIRAPRSASASEPIDRARSDPDA